MADVAVVAFILVAVIFSVVALSSSHVPCPLSKWSSSTSSSSIGSLAVVVLNGVLGRLHAHIVRIAIAKQGGQRVGGARGAAVAAGAAVVAAGAAVAAAGATRRSVLMEEAADREPEEEEEMAAEVSSDCWLNWLLED